MKNQNPDHDKLIGIPFTQTAMGIYSPAFCGVRHMIGIQGDYSPDPPPPPPPEGGTPVATNVVKFKPRGKTHSQIANNAAPLRRAA